MSSLAASSNLHTALVVVTDILDHVVLHSCLGGSVMGIVGNDPGNILVGWVQFVGKVTNIFQVLGSLGTAGTGIDITPAQVQLRSTLGSTKDNLI